ncbi:hypothetical protein MTR67_052190 [Solanum verrucosum]|uniref:Uncharacterized protein n=1 Tax=Solanum verrucosum TaxID=315347 RepID=A0AAF1A326_SOLVR|nr:hypothetical protein MTR67_052190 [Solanum verrucosum]
MFLQRLWRTSEVLMRRWATLYLKLWNSPGTIFIFLISKRSALFDLLESFLTTKSPEGLRASQLACRATLYLKLWNSPGTIFIFLIPKSRTLFDLLESFLTTKSPEDLRASQLACRRWLFRIASLASSTELEALVYSSEICNGSSFQSWATDHGCPYFHAYGIEKILWT